MRQNNAGRRAVPYVNFRAILRNKRLMLLIVAVVLLLIILISGAVNRSKRAKLEEEVAALQTSVSQLEGEKSALQSQLDAQKQQTAAAQANAENVIRAMDLFWQIDESFVLSRHSRARDLIRTLEAEELAKYLPAASTTDNGRFSPYDRYAEICEALKEPYGAGVKEG